MLSLAGQRSPPSSRRRGGTAEPTHRRTPAPTCDSLWSNAAYQRRGAATSAACACSPGGSTADGRETKHTRQPRCYLEIAKPQPLKDLVELACINECTIWPAALALQDQRDSEPRATVGLPHELTPA